jgi:epoxyqueuosine reductase QueG
MVGVFRRPLTAADIKAQARALGADLVGIADGAVLDANPPDPADPRRPSDITALDGGRVIVLAKKLSSGVTRISAWGDRHKYYNDELALTALEETSLDLVYWLEDAGYPAIIVPPTHVDPWRYEGEPREHQTTLLSLPHAAVEAGLGTLGLNLQLLTPEYGPRVLLTAVLCSVDVECDRPMTEALCLGPACGRCLAACPGDTVQHWGRDWEKCDEYRSPYGFAKLTGQIERIVDAPDAQARKELLRSETTFNLWQSILRGAGVITGCRRCADVCPVGADYDAMLRDALDAIPEHTAEKEARLAAMRALEAQHDPGLGYREQARWIAKLKPVSPSKP